MRCHIGGTGGIYTVPHIWCQREQTSHLVKLLLPDFSGLCSKLYRVVDLFRVEQHLVQSHTELIKYQSLGLYLHLGLEQIKGIRCSEFCCYSQIFVS